MGKIKLKHFSFLLAENILNSKLDLKNEIESIIINCDIDFSEMSRPNFNNILRDTFENKGWELQHQIINKSVPSMRIDFLKKRIGVHVAFTHPSFIGSDLLKFQIASFSCNNIIDLGVYIVTTKDFQKYLSTKYDQAWDTSLTFKKVIEYLPHVRSVIQVPIYVIGIDI